LVSVAFYIILLLKNLGDNLFKEYIVAYGCGLLFGSGLMISGLCRVSKVINFLTIGSHWDMTILFILVTALLFNFLGQLILHGPQRPRGPSDVSLNARDSSILGIGAALFGLGWGLTGLTPGTAIINLFILTHCIFYVVGMALGQVLYDHGVVPVFMKDSLEQAKEKLMS